MTGDQRPTTAACPGHCWAWTHWWPPASTWGTCPAPARRTPSSPLRLGHPTQPPCPIAQGFTASPCSASWPTWTSSHRGASQPCQVSTARCALPLGPWDLDLGRGLWASRPESSLQPRSISLRGVTAPHLAARWSVGTGSSWPGWCPDHGTSWLRIFMTPYGGLKLVPFHIWGRQGPRLRGCLVAGLRTCSQEKGESSCPLPRPRACTVPAQDSSLSPAGRKQLSGWGWSAAAPGG